MVNQLEVLLKGYVLNMILLNICEFLFVRAVRLCDINDNNRATKHIASDT